MSLEELLKRVDEAGFTPGPWWACIGSDQPVPYYRGLVMYVSHDPQITICTGAEGDQSGRTCDSSEWEANARLIAAAPDMFEALSRWVDLAETAIRELGIEPHPDERKCLDLARGALAKARATPVSDTAPAGQGGEA